MTNPAILEALTEVIGNGRISDYPSTLIAAAVLELVGPRKLEWASIPITKEHEGLAGLWLCSWGPLGQYQVHMFDTDPSHVMLNGPDIVPTGIHGTIESAQAAAQAHADAAHWANCPLGKLAGVV